MAVKTRRAVRWTLIAAFAGSLACSRADLYPITRDSLGGSSGDGGGGTAGGGTAGGGSGGTSGSGGTFGSAGGGNGGSAGSLCPAPVLEPGDSNRMVVVGGVMRSYILHVPPAYDGSKPVPLVVDFHGLGQSAASERTSSPYPAVLDPEGVVMAFPEGRRGPAGNGWNVGPCCVAGVDDVAFARALVRDVVDNACIDATRVYAVGVLTGGGMAHYLACHAADVFAAVSPAAFDLLEENVDDCIPARPISVVSFRGTADSRVPYEGGPSSLVPGMPLTFLGARATFETWAELNGCTGSAAAADANGCEAYTTCDGGTEIILCTEEGGQEEPGDPNVAWPVLKRHTL
jgi:polyhydroxybutyrate depolymerase